MGQFPHQSSCGNVMCDHDVNTILVDKKQTGENANRCMGKITSPINSTWACYKKIILDNERSEELKAALRK